MLDHQVEVWNITSNKHFLNVLLHRPCYSSSAGPTYIYITDPTSSVHWMRRKIFRVFLLTYLLDKLLNIWTYSAQGHQELGHCTRWINVHHMYYFLHTQIEPLEGSKCKSMGSRIRQSKFSSLLHHLLPVQC